MSTEYAPPSGSGTDPEAGDVRTNDQPDSNPGQPPPPAKPGSTKIFRNTNDKIVGGICGGLGTALGVDPVWFRLGFIFLALSSGVGFLLYLIAWIIIPEAPDGVTLAPRDASNSAIAFGILLLAVGSALFVDALVPWFDRVAWPVAVIGLGIGLLLFGSRKGQT